MQLLTVSILCHIACKNGAN